MCARRAAVALSRQNPYYRNDAVFTPFSSVEAPDQRLKILDRLDEFIKTTFYKRDFYLLERELVGPQAVGTVKGKKLVLGIISSLAREVDVCLHNLLVEYGERVKANPHLLLFHHTFTTFSGEAVSTEGWGGLDALEGAYQRLRSAYASYQDGLSDPDRKQERGQFLTGNIKRRKRSQTYLDQIRRCNPKVSIQVTSGGLGFTLPRASPTQLKERVDAFIQRLYRLTTASREYGADYLGFYAKPTIHLDYGPYWVMAILHRPGIDWQDVIKRCWVVDATQGKGQVLSLNHYPDTLPRLKDYDHMLCDRDRLVTFQNPPDVDRLRRTVNHPR